MQHEAKNQQAAVYSNYLGTHAFIITKFLQILVLLNNTQKPNSVQRISRLKLYKTLALPTLLYGSEIWTLKQCDKNRLRTAETKYLRRTAGYILLDHKRQEGILEKLHVTSLEENFVHTDTIGSNTFIEWKTTGSLKKNF
jgi:hypothetical protein